MLDKCELCSYAIIASCHVVHPLVYHTFHDEYQGANEVIGANYGVTTLFFKPLLIV
jgi:hypothetical protein